MSDPYEVLGVPRNASTDQIKAAYRELAKKYHPDNYANNPLADLAAEKMKEINEAYDQIVRQRQNGGGQSGGQGYQAGASSGGASSGQYGNVRDLINGGRMAEAQGILDAVPAGRRDAEWFFLKGSVFFKNGWANEAYTYFQTAVRMEPGNLEYRQALQRLSWQMNNTSPFGQNYGGYNGYGNGGNCSFCDLCAGMMCADCLCQGCGGC